MIRPPQPDRVKLVSNIFLVANCFTYLQSAFESFQYRSFWCLEFKKNNFSLCKKLFGHTNHHQLLNEFVWYNFFAFLSNLNSHDQLVTMQQSEKKKNAFLPGESALCHKLLYITSFLNKISLSNSFCSLRSGFPRARYNGYKFFLVLVFFEAFETIPPVKQWSVLF